MTNPICGASVLAWCRDRLREQGFTVMDPEPEHWGWYVDVRSGAERHLLGASAEPPEDQGAVEWTLQIDRPRTIMDRLRGRGELRVDDRLTSTLEALLRHDAAVTDLVIDR